MRTLREMIDETVALLEKSDIPHEDIECAIEVFMDVLESHDGTIRFNAQVNHQRKVVNVGVAGEKAKVGR